MQNHEEVHVAFHVHFCPSELGVFGITDFFVLSMGGLKGEIHREGWSHLGGRNVFRTAGTKNETLKCSQQSYA